MFSTDASVGYYFMTRESCLNFLNAFKMSYLCSSESDMIHIITKLLASFLETVFILKPQNY